MTRWQLLLGLAAMAVAIAAAAAMLIGYGTIALR